ncbi:redoxin domain-containing protein [Niastella caeni]|uniref:Redoxin domain-containing protein n=1 Tax=Niastella caeni TaxID=2569763 RepID=A0A4S8HV57_9BACT|nr:redoxin domain-containing protein [Niastella caeni]THU39497.1 redoxin domain-containing protein [Niastella caeni]
MKKISAFFILACLAGCFGKEPQKTGKEGTPLPEFKLLLMDSVTWVNTRDIPTGNPIALFFFSPYCPYCRDQTLEIIEEIDELKNIQFYFVTSFPPSTLKDFKKAYQLAKYSNITIAIDPQQALGNYFEITGIPYIAIYSKDKKLNHAFKGKITFGQLKKVAEE